jgi:hypothetical protein
MAYLLEPFQGLCRELVLLAMRLEVGNQLGEDRLELLEGGGHVDGSAGQVEREIEVRWLYKAFWGGLQVCTGRMSVQESLGRLLSRADSAMASK